MFAFWSRWTAVEPWRGHVTVGQGFGGGPNLRDQVSKVERVQASGDRIFEASDKIRIPRVIL